MNLFEPDFYKHATLLTLAIIGLLAALRKLAELIKTFVPKNLVEAFRNTFQALPRWILQELTLPKRYPFAETVTEVMFTAIFYILTLYYFLMFLMVVSLIFFGNAAPWKYAAAFAVAIVIMVMARWCFKQAEVPRIKLNSKSRNLW
ncbi:hypothetical protein FHW69_003806 [Luteibacter sp. Sphag1AF]|uniref:hypothetical protein n=1 Tax=Luteibacter sp. Sphag1AF TaxID=2587031 RepID=UPI001621DA6B|nr:hypothetical protein [Luteibacter sp. Sphag1AF]MBB3229152.1 hypothetical protein [Luteibacter sp. Sphag1AF]